MTDGVRMRDWSWAGGGLVLVVVATVSVSACGSPGTRAGADRAVRAVERNFSIRVPHTVAPGLVRFDITGAGPTMHEFNVVRTTRSAEALPVAADGTVDDQSPHTDFTHLGEAEGIDIGDHKSLTVRLAPGQYVLYCNMDGHYQSGMATELTVAAR